MTDFEQIKLTPMLEQYLEIKAEYQDCLLFYRMGDFYELFFEDAVVASKALQIALTSRNRNADKPVHMCGVPYHSAEPYLITLLNKGFDVAVCEQVEDPKEAKGLVRRQVTHIRTPGTALDDGCLEAKEHNYLSAFLWDEKSSLGGACWVEFTTGEFNATDFKDEAALWGFAQKINPREIILPENMTPPKSFFAEANLKYLDESKYFKHSQAETLIKEHEKTIALEPLDLKGRSAVAKAVGAVLIYLKQTQRSDLSHLKKLRVIRAGAQMIVDEVTERNLEIFRRLDGGKGKGTLFKVLDRTRTPMGGRALESRLKSPWLSINKIESQQEVVGWFLEKDLLRGDLLRTLDGVYDLERLSTRISLGRTTPKDFIFLRDSLQRLPDIRKLFFADDLLPMPKVLKGAMENFDDLADVCGLLAKALLDNPPHLITEGGLFRTGYNAELDEIVRLAEEGESLLQELLLQERKESNLSKLKLGNNKVFGYYFELPRNESYVPEHFVRKQTLANAERYVTPELKGMEEKILEAGGRRNRLEYELFGQLREEIANLRPRITFMADLLAQLDLWSALAQVAAENGWNKPEIHSGLEFSIIGGRHPVVEALQTREPYIPNDLLLNEERSILLITGPNMAGKSTILRQSAIIAILAQIGSFVPADKARLGIVDRVFSRVGASDNLAQGVSTFMTEMMETARILRQCSKKSLVILDEIGRGTSTFDGLALAWAVVESLAGQEASQKPSNKFPFKFNGVRTLFATHYHELTDLEGRIPGVKNANVAVAEHGGKIVFLRRLLPGATYRSYGVEVAKLAGVPERVVRRAREILDYLEKKALALRNNKIETSRRPSLFPDLDKAEIKEEESVNEKLPTASLDLVAFDSLNELKKALTELDPLLLTPMEALNLLVEWKEKWGESRDLWNLKRE